MIKPPAPRPCISCPYRCDVPSGIWSPEEYEKLPPFDNETGQQPTSVFMCHQQDGRLCAGWTATHEMTHNLGLRIAIAAGKIADEDIKPILDYATDVPLFTNGQEARDHGVAEVSAPNSDAVRMIQKIAAKHRDDP